MAINGEPALLSNGDIMLGNLVTFHQIGVEVVLTCEPCMFRDGAIQGQGRNHCVFHCLFVGDREAAGHAQTDGADMGIGRGIGVVGTARAEHLAFR